MIDASSENVEATRSLMRKSISTETPYEEDHSYIFEVIPAEHIPEAAPEKYVSSSLKSKPLLQAVAAVPTEPAISTTPLPPRPQPIDRPPPIPLKKVHSSNVSTSLSRNPSLYEPDPFTRRRTKDSFQGSLESIDSLVESYWDPEEDVSLTTPIRSNMIQSMDVPEEHVDFLLVRTQPRSVEVVWETPDWDADLDEEFLSMLNENPNDLDVG